MLGFRMPNTCASNKVNNNSFFLLANKELELLVMHDSVKEYKIYIRKLISNTVKDFWHAIVLT